jgi:hypothetical protein
VVIKLLKLQVAIQTSISISVSILLFPLLFFFFLSRLKKVENRNRIFRASESIGRTWKDLPEMKKNWMDGWIGRWVAIDIDSRTVTLLVIRLTAKKEAKRKEEGLHARELRIAQRVTFSAVCHVLAQVVAISHFAGFFGTEDRNAHR